MESAILFALLVLAVILLGPWLIAFRALRKTRASAELAEQRWESVRDRLANLERLFEEIKETLAGFDKEAAPAATPPANEKAQISPLLRHDFRPAPQPPEPIVPPVVPETLPGTGITPPLKVAEPAPPPLKTSPAVSPPVPAPATPAQKVGLEEKVGANWLNKVGIVMLVLGVAFLISTLMQTLGATGKVLLGFTVSGALLGLGIFAERFERYRVLARAGIAGGWALLFFTAYAMHHVSAARVLESQTADLFLMMAVAAVMVWHTLRYDSQVVTGMAFLLAFLTVSIGRGSVFSLTAGVVLAAALCVLVLRRRWFELEIFGILATFLNHWYWLRPIIEPMGNRHHAFPEFVASAAILCSYWLIFRLSYVLRRTDGDQKVESISTVAALLNAGLLLAIMRYQSVRPELAFWFLLGLGGAELLLGQLPIARRRRASFVVLTVLGTSLLVAAIPYRYSGMSLAILWIAEALALLMAGIGTDETVFRRLGLLALAPPILRLVLLDVNRAADIAPDPKIAFVCAFAALAAYLSSEWFPRRWPKMFPEGASSPAGYLVIAEYWYRVGLSYAALVLAMLAAWAGLHDAWVGVAWAVLGFALAFAGRRSGAARLSTQSNAIAAAALIRVLTVNVDIPGRFHAIGLRLITMSSVAGLLYLSAPWSSLGDRRGRIPAAYTWAASFLVALLAWYELRPVSVAVAWAVFGLLLLELGLLKNKRDLLDQGLLALAAAFTRIFFVNLNADAVAGQLSPRVYTVIPLVLIFYYAYERLRARGAEGPHPTINWRTTLDGYASAALCWFGGVSIAALIRFELNVNWVVAAWAAGAAVLLAVALALHRRVFLHQALVAAAAVLFRGILHNFYEHSYFAGHWGPASQAILVASALLFAALPLAFRVAGENSRAAPGNPAARAAAFLTSQPYQPLFFIPLALVTVLLALELRTGMITVGWGVEGVIVFLLALWIGQRSYRLAGLGLLLLCVGKILVIDVWRMQGTDRYLTLIVMGSALLLVSFLYSRHREALRQYL